MSEYTQTKVEDLDKKEFVKFRSTVTAPVWIFTHYSRQDKRYYFTAFDDSNNEITKRKGTTCFIGFTF